MSKNRRPVITSINMRDFGGNSSSSSQTPLLSPASSGSDDEYDSNVGTSYRSTAVKNDAIITIGPQSEDEEGDEDDGDPQRALADSPSHGGVQQADAINQVWSRAALVTAYLLYVGQF